MEGALILGRLNMGIIPISCWDFRTFFIHQQIARVFRTFTVDTDDIVLRVENVEQSQ